MNTNNPIPPAGLNTPEAPHLAAHGQKQDQKGPVTEIGGRSGPEPTRFGDWERDGKCVDF